MINKSKDIKIRTFEMSLRIIDLLEVLPSNYVYQTIGRQLVRCGTSIGANVMEAQAGRTDKDFSNYYQIALKSAIETSYWLEIINRKLPHLENMNELLGEVIEIRKMIAASIITMKKKL